MTRYTQSQWIGHLGGLMKDIRGQACLHRKEISRDFLRLYSGVARLSRTLRESMDLPEGWAQTAAEQLDSAEKALKAGPGYKGFVLDLSATEKVIKVERTRLLPPNLPKGRNKNRFFEFWYDFFRVRLFPIERLLRWGYVRFRFWRSLEYNSRYFLHTLFRRTEADLKRVTEETEYVLAQVRDIYEFTIQGQETGDETKRNIKGGLKRAAALIDPVLADFVRIRAKTHGLLDEAIYGIQRNVMEESMLARTSVESVIWTGRDIDRILGKIGDFFHSIWDLRRIFTRSGEEVARNVPKVFERIERTISLEEGPSSFLLDMTQDTTYPDELARVFSPQPAEIPIFYGRDKLLMGLAAEYNRFKSGRLSLVMLVGASGSGKRSVMKNAMKDWNDFVEWEIEQRITDPLELDQMLADVLRLESRDVEEGIHKGQRRIVLVRRMERLYRRGIGGYDALKRFIDIVTATGNRIMWVLQTNDIAFSFIDGIYGLGRMSSRVIHIEPFSRKELEEMLMHRLHFTGYRYFFLPDLELSERAKKKLKDQKKLRTMFFDRIYEMSLGNPLAALFFTGNSVRRVSESTVFFRTPPAARFDALAKGPLPEKLWFKGMLEAGGYFPEEIAGRKLAVAELSESMGIIERRYITGGEILTARRTMEPFIRNVLADAGLIRSRNRSVIR